MTFWDQPMDHTGFSYPSQRRKKPFSYLSLPSSVMVSKCIHYSLFVKSVQKKKYITDMLSEKRNSNMY